jgi:hypothetical protein
MVQREERSMSDPHDIATDLREAAGLCFLEWQPPDEMEMLHAIGARLEALADSFDQPGPLAYDETTGRMVRMVPTAEHVWAADGEMSLVIHDGWRFPSRGTSEGADS